MSQSHAHSRPAPPHPPPSVPSYVGGGARAASDESPENFSDLPSVVSYAGGARAPSTVVSRSSGESNASGATPAEAPVGAAALEAQTEGAVGGAPIRRPEGSVGGGQQSSRPGGRGRDYIEAVIFGGYSKDNKKEFMVRD